ncbi:MAG TPA: DUF5683 domain-containing protein, partial [Bacteroidota bacterium]
MDVTYSDRFFQKKECHAERSEASQHNWALRFFGRLPKNGRLPQNDIVFFVVVIFSLTLVSQNSFGQQIRGSFFEREQLYNATFLPDSVVAIAPPQTKSTTLAVVLSAVVPGAGQVYSKRYLTIPIIWGFGIYFGSQWNKADNRYSEARDRYRLSIEGGGTGDAQARYERDFYHDER